MGADALTAWYASTNVLNLMRAITGSQWRSVSSGVVCIYLGTLNIRRMWAERKAQRGGAEWGVGRGVEVKELQMSAIFSSKNAAKSSTVSMLYYV